MLNQEDILRSKKELCENANETEPPSEDLFCPHVWDGAICWPFVEAGTVANQSCPEYVSGFNTSGFATKICNVDGTWFYSEDKNTTWTNYTECMPTKSIETSISFFELDLPFTPPAMYQKYIPIIRIISRTGYCVSLVSLSIAVFILASNKKLRCPRNNVHLNLFASFIMRAVMTLLLESFVGKRISLKDSNDWLCKFIVSVWHFSLMTNYHWFLMEGIYIHTLIFFTVFSDNSGINVYVGLGWGLPLLFTSIWMYARFTLADNYCWTLNDNKHIYWIIRGPITFTIVINFLIFINICRILFLKLTSSQVTSSRGSRYRRLAKSTLILVPLFGIHHMFLLSFPEVITQGSISELIWLFCDLLFCTFQGFFVAVLYCFLNGEVQSEIRKKIQRIKEDKNYCSQREWKRFHQIIDLFNQFPKIARFTTKRDESRRMSSSHSRIPKDCTTNTTYFNNTSTPTTPKIEHIEENFNWGPYPLNGDINSTPLFDRSAIREIQKPNGFSVPNEYSEAPTVLTPMLTKEQTNGPLSPESPSKEKLELLYLERINSVDHSESRV